MHMEKCSVCGNSYDNCFEVIQKGNSYFFDSFECAIQKLAPTCKHCSCRIIGHGIEAGKDYYCCANCARACGVENARDDV
ncbi:hypothetical protein [Legionella clemsonensis]|uniref:Metallothionein n=1 Tax=Legionella clemsonensis TaxID=1867846 RepID=A0A222NZG5_9GAMM|nr:hypothetical protein [Legionella clemsonensis]ASQ44993.1 hypothetical protein clem_02150 [Legionella clemsonensis]